MTLDAVRDPYPPPHRTGRRGRWELTDVRHPLHPGVRLDRVIVCASGVHVVTALPAADDGGPDTVLVGVGHLAADVVRSLLPARYRDRVRPVLCVTVPDPVADLVEGVLVTTAETLEHIVRSSPVVLSTSEAHEVVLRLEARLIPAPRPEPRSQVRRTRRTRLLAATAAGTAAVAVLLDRAALTLPW